MDSPIVDRTTATAAASAPPMPAPKRLKCSEPDLTLFLGTEEKPFHCYSNIMASHSDYIDTMLASPMVESQTLELRFPDIQPEVWVKMVDYLEDPFKAVEMTLKDSTELAPIYDKYHFKKGCLMCSHSIAKEFNELEVPYMPEQLELDHMIDLVLLADAAHLKKAYTAGIRFLRTMISRFSYGVMFKEDQIKRIVPLIAKEDKLLSAVNCHKEITKEDVSSTLFPTLMVETYSALVQADSHMMAISSIKLSGCRCKADGEYVLEYGGRTWGPAENKTRRWRDQPVRFYIKRSSNDWEIIGYMHPVDGDWENAEQKTLFRAPNSRNLALPPASGWESVSADLCTYYFAGPEIEYLYRGEEEED